MPYSVDLRKRVISAIDEGMRPSHAAKTFKVCRKAIYNWLDLREETNSLAPKTGYQKGHSHKITDWDDFKKFASQNKHLTVKRMTIEWEKINNKTISESAMEKALKKIGYTSKKNFWVYGIKSKKT